VAAGCCDVAERCDGNTVTCPANAYANDATVCLQTSGTADSKLGSANPVCTEQTIKCTGSGPCCPYSQLKTTCGGN
jgi:hypothetical protein